MNQAYYALATMQGFFSTRLDSRKDRGATAVEYGLMVGLIAVAIILAVVFLGDAVTAIFDSTAETMVDEGGLEGVTRGGGEG